MGHDQHGQLETLGTFARLDHERTRRAGIPEAVFAEGKTHEQVIGTLRGFADRGKPALATRVSDACADAVLAALSGQFLVEHNAIGRTIVVRALDWKPDAFCGRIAILAAGTADMPVAEEAHVTAVAMGCEVLTYYDVGVAGIHRLVDPLESILQKEVSAVVVVAGMEGALASVVKGLVPVPVIGVPTSTGYGYGGRGEAALMSMLQSCSPGLTVVNIDNGFGAGSTAAMIAAMVTKGSTNVLPPMTHGRTPMQATE